MTSNLALVGRRRLALKAIWLLFQRWRHRQRLEFPKRRFSVTVTATAYRSRAPRQLIWTEDGFEPNLHDVREAKRLLTSVFARETLNVGNFQVTESGVKKGRQIFTLEFQVT